MTVPTGWFRSFLGGAVAQIRYREMNSERSDEIGSLTDVNN